MKRSHNSDVGAGEERVRDNGAIYGQPTAIKRGNDVISVISAITLFFFCYSSVFYLVKEVITGVLFSLRALCSQRIFGVDT